MMTATRTKRTSPKYLDVADDIHRLVREGVYAPGEVIPSQKSLMEQYGVSLITLRKALNVLYNQRVLCSQPGKGMFVSKRRPAEVQRKRGRIGLAFVGSDFYRSMIKQESLIALQRVLEKQNFELLIRSLPTTEINTAADTLNGMFLVGEVDQNTVAPLRRKGVPTLLVSEMHDAYSPSRVAQIGGDLEGCVDMAVGYLKEQGHDAICLALRKGARAWRKAKDYLRKAAERYSLEVPPTTVSIATFASEKNLADTLGDLLPKPTAVIATGGQMGSRVVRALQDSGLILPQDISLLAINTVSEEHLLNPNISRVTVNQVDVWEAAATAMIHMIETGQTVYKTLPPRLTFGDTCGDVPLTPFPKQTHTPRGTSSHEPRINRRNY